MPILSIIVPVYNVDKWLSRCIDSILTQRFQDFELILVNDNSADQSGAICDSYAQKDHRIIVMHHEKNGGVSNARNTGLKIAQGTYVGFVDPDDWIAPEMYFEMISKIKTDSEIDLVCVKYDSYTEKMTCTSHPKTILDNTSLDNVSFVDYLLDIPSPISVHVWNKLFKREKIQNTFDVKYKNAEDIKFLFEYVTECRKISFLNNELYHYFKRNVSASRNSCAPVGDDSSVWNDIFQMIRNTPKLYHFSDKMIVFLLDNCLRNIKRTLLKSEKERIFIIYKNIIKKHFKDILLNRRAGIKQKIFILSYWGFFNSLIKLQKCTQYFFTIFYRSSNSIPKQRVIDEP